MKMPIHQQVIFLLTYLTIGFIALGTFFDAIGNAITFISPTTTYIGSLIILVLWIGTEIFLRIRPARWIARGNQEVSIKRLGIRRRLEIVGAILFLWIPLLAQSRIVQSIIGDQSDIRLEPTTNVNKQSSPDRITDVFPFYVGGTWVYNFGILSEAIDTGSPRIGQVIGSYTERVVIIETGFANSIRIIGVEQTGENFLSTCSSQALVSGDLTLWYVADSHRLYTECSRADAFATAMNLRLEGDRGTTPISEMPEYVVPFEVGNLWPAFPDPSPRDDTAYQWHVEALVEVNVPADRFVDCYRIVLFTLPDSSVRWVCPGVGLVAQEYHHHGSVVDYRAELTSYEVSPHP